MEINVNDLISKIDAVINNLQNYKYRLTNKDNLPGGLIELPDSIFPIIIGDLHSNLHHLKLILNDENNLEKLQSKENYVLIILGDAIHNDQTGHMMEQPGSMEILEYIFDLILTYPGKIIYIRGNHDTFDPQLRKSGISQGLEFQKYLIKTYGDEVTDKIGEFFDCLPYFITGSNYIITHAGPIRGGVVKENLINIRHYPDQAFQLTWNRVHEFRGNPSKKEYSEDDIKKSIQLLNMPSDSTFIVGHNPLWNTGDKTGVWQNIVGIKNHHILYSGSGSLAPYFVRENDTFKIKYALKQRAIEEVNYDR